MDGGHARLVGYQPGWASAMITPLNFWYGTMQTQSRQVRVLSRLELGLLCAFMLVVPIMEAPKNIFLVLFTLVWLVRSFRQNNFGHLSPVWDALFALSLIIPFLCIAFSSPYPHKWNAMGDIVSCILLGWVLARSQLQRTVRPVLTCVVISTLLGVVQGYYVLATNPQRVWLQLNAVGHVNHSALFGVGAALIGVALALWQDGISRLQRRWAVFAAFALFGAVIGFASRGAVLAYVFGLILLMWPALRRQGAFSILHVAGVVVLGVVVAWGAQTAIVQVSQSKNPTASLSAKTEENIRDHRVMSERDRLARNAIEQWRHNPVFGVGVSNFSAVSPELMRSWLEARGEQFDPDKYLFSNHAHNLYMNTLAERGLAGECLLLLLGIAWACALWRRRPQAGSAAPAYWAWAAGVSGWTVVYAGGVFNTTFHHGHGMLAMVCLGLLLGSSVKISPQKQK